LGDSFGRQALRSCREENDLNFPLFLLVLNASLWWDGIFKNEKYRRLTNCLSISFLMKA